MKIDHLKNQVLIVLDYVNPNKKGLWYFIFLVKFLIPNSILSQKSENFLFNPSEINIPTPQTNTPLNLPKNLKSYNSSTNLLNYLLKIKYERFDFIDSSILANKLPVIFEYLPLISSGYQINHEGAFSKRGVWGLAYLTALRSELIVNNYIDERFDIKLSTKASITYLQNLMKLYKDENWAMLAFITSPNYVSNIIKNNGSQKWEDCKKYITPRFLKVIELAAWLEKNKKQEIKNSIFKKNTVSKLNLYTFKENIYFDAIAQYKKIDFNKIINSNPVLINSVLPKNYPVYLKRSTGNYIIKKIDEILNFQDSMLNDLYLDNLVSEQKRHLVIQGDVLGQIAIDYDVSISQIMSWNNLKNTTIYQGQKLLIFSNSSPNLENLFNHTISNEKYFWQILNKYPYLKIKDICKYNSYQKLKPNQKLKIIKK